MGWGIAAGTGLVFLPHLRRGFDWLAPRLDLNSRFSGVAFWFLWYLGVAYLLLGLIGSRVEHFRYWRTRPPLTVAGASAIVFSLLLKPLRAAGTWPTRWGWLSALCHELIYSTLIIGIPLVWTLLKRAAIPSIVQNSISNQALPEEVLGWTNREEPITKGSDDRFALTDRVGRLLEVLRSAQRQTIGITGPFGSGKSSLVSLLEEAVAQTDHEPDIWFAKVSCWGFPDAAAAQESVLKQIVQTIREKVDVWSLRSLPEDYVRAISAASTTANVLLSFFRKTIEPVEQLQRLSPMLAAVRARLIIVIEDVDRSGTSFDFGQIQALLYRFRAVEGISFIITADPNRAPIDFAKLCDHQEDLQPLSEQFVLDIVEPVRGRLLATFTDDVELTERSPTLRQQEQSIRHWSYRFLTGRKHPTQALARLLSTPRSLKSTLRRLEAAWQRLHGEVDFDELLYVTILRVAAPLAFDYLLRHFDALQRRDWTVGGSSNSSAAFSKQDVELERLREEWELLCERREFDRSQVGQLIRELLPQANGVFGDGHPGSTLGLQKCRELGITNYWQRMVSESLQHGEYRDQTVFRTIHKATLNQISLKDVAAEMVASEEFSTRFEKFGKDFDRLLDLSTEVYAATCLRHGQKARFDYPGCFELYRLLGNRVVIFSDPVLVNWLLDQIEKAVPLYIRFAQDIYQYWFTNHHAGRALLRKARARLLRTMRNTFSQPSAPSICDCLDEDDPFWLSHLLCPYDSNRKQYAPYSNAKVWRWLAPHLLSACAQCPDKILPQLLVEFNKPSGQTNSGGMISYEFDLKKLEAFFGVSKDLVLKSVANGFSINPAFDHNLHQLFELAVVRAKQLI